MRTKLQTVCLAALASQAVAQTSYPFFGYHKLDAVAGTAIADLDGDGNPELIARGAQFTTRVFHNAGHARFDSFTDYQMPEYPGYTAAADVTGDGVTDVIVLGSGQDLITVRPGLGDGQLGDRIDSPVPHASIRYVLVELTGDGLPDVVTEDGEQLLLLPGDGNGVFGAPQPLASTLGPVKRLAAADLNNDGLQDIVAIATDPPDCLVLLAAPGGGIEEPIHLAAPQDTTSLALADADADGSTDILIGQTNESGGHPRGVWLYTNDGAGQFPDPPVFTSTGVPGVSAQPFGVGVADLTGDGLPDLVVSGQHLLIFRGTGNPAAPFGGGFTWGRVDELTDITFGDLNTDGVTDMVVSGSDCLAFLNDGTGAFRAPWAEIPMVHPDKLAAGDLNDDGVTDLAILAEVARDDDNSSSLSLLLTDGAGGYTHTPTIDLPADALAFDLQPIDRSAPGNLDVTLCGRNNLLWLSNLGGQGQQWLGLSDPTVITHNYNDLPRGLHVIDFEFLGNEQNTPDPDLLLVSTHRSNSNDETYFHTFRNDGTDHYTAEPTQLLPYHSLWSAIADTDGDGDTDVLYTSTTSTSALRTRLNQVIGSTAKDRASSAGVGDHSEFRMRDMDGDGDTDAIVFSSRNYDGGASLLFNNGIGGFTTGETLFERAGVAFDVGYLNDDPWLDAVVLSGQYPSEFIELAVFLGDDQRRFTGPYVTTLRALPDGWSAEDIVILDIDNDGQGEVAAAISNPALPTLGALLLLDPRNPDPDPCPADFNNDGAVDTRDVLAFLNAWSAGDDSADINADGVIDTRDVLAFLNLWGAGC